MLRNRKHLFSVVGVVLMILFLFPLVALAVNYQVASGDTLWTISQKFGVGTQDIRNANGLSSDLIYPGQVLNIPGTDQNSGGTGSAGEYAALRQRIQDYLAKEEGTYGIYVKDLITGHEFGINENTALPAASTVKLPTVLYINKLAAQGNLDWQQKLTYDPNLDYQGGSGILQFSVQYGNRFTIRTLTTMAITTSDNIAYNMLRRFAGRSNIATYMAAAGGKTVFPGGRNLSTARDMGTYVQAALDLNRNYPQVGRRLLDDMANGIYNEGIPALLPDSVTVAHKEGFVTGSTNDVGVVFGSRPFIISVLTQGETNDTEGFANIAKIAKMVYDYQEQL